VFHDRELTHYNEAMEKSLADKLFFLDHFTAGTYVDFGCANGALFKGIAARQSNAGWQGYGIDNNDFQLRAAAAKFPDAIYALDFAHVADHIRSRPGKKAAIFSSVLHEAPDLVNHAGEWADYVVIRDMGIVGEFASTTAARQLQGALARHEGWRTFLAHKRGVDAPGHPATMGLVTEFLLKAPYLDDPNSERFKREIAERYPLSRVEDLIYGPSDDGFVISHFEHYSLPYIRDRIRREFGFDFPYPTHFKLILQRVQK